MVTPPSCDPTHRNPAEVSPAGSYRRDDTVWVYRNGSWHPGIVNGASPLAVMVTYQSLSGRGTVVDTVTAEYLIRHGDPGPAGGDR